MADQNGPPKGSPAASPYAGVPIPMADPYLDEYTKSLRVQTDDPGFQPPRSPLGNDIRARTRAIIREIPLVTIQHQWQIEQIRNALRTHNEGIFDYSAQLTDSMLGDPRIQATLGSRVSGLFGHEVKFKPAEDANGNVSRAAQECHDAWVEHWPQFATTAALITIHVYSIFMGYSPGQLLWDTAGPIWKPYLRPWHPRYVYYHWYLLKYMALSQDGEIPIVAGDGKWINHCPYGEYRGWIRGAVRGCSEPWYFRHCAIRDQARFSEVHGMPIRKAIVPASSDEVQRDRFAQQLQNPGREMTLMVPRGQPNDGQLWDLELVEAKDTAFEVFTSLRDHCDMDIVLTLLFQNLTTEVKGGSFAATTAHMDIRTSGVQSDNEAWKLTLYEQVARPFAYLNFGDADLAPTTDWDVQPIADYDIMANLLSKFGTSVEVLRRGGIQFKNPDDLRDFAKSIGITLPEVEFKDPVSGGLGK